MNLRNKVTGELSSITTYDPVTGEITGLVPIGNTTLGSNANIIITGGNPGEVLTTDGAGNLSWSAGGSAGSQITNGTSRVAIETLDGPIIMTVAGSSSGNINQNSIALGYLSGLTNQQSGATAVGLSAGNDSQGNNSVAVGFFAGETLQGNLSIAIGSEAGRFNQNDSAISMGTLAGQFAQNVNSVAIGTSAAQDTQGSGGVAIGLFAGQVTQADEAIAIGANAAVDAQGAGAVAIGGFAGSVAQSANAVAIGYNAAASVQRPDAIAIGNSAGQLSQGASSISVGQLAGNDEQGANSIAIGISAGQNRQSSNSVAIGQSSGASDQGAHAIAIGSFSGNITQGANAVAIGFDSGNNTQSANAIAIGQSAGASTQGLNGVAIGLEAAQTSQSANAVAIGTTAGGQSQGVAAVAIGYRAGSSNQGSNAIAIGSISGVISQQSNTIAIGTNAASNTQAVGSIAIGSNAASNSQATSSIAIGTSAGANAQASNAVAIGTSAGSFAQTFDAVAIGRNAGNSLQGGNSIAIGLNAANTNQGTNAVAIGAVSGGADQAANSVAIGSNAQASGAGIALNATGSVLNATAAGLYVSPIRNDIVNITNAIYYNTTTKELTYGSGGGIRAITKISEGYNYGTTLILADGRLFATKGTGNGNAWYASHGNADNNSAPGLNNLYEIYFDSEDTALVVDAGTYSQSAYALFDNGNLYTWGYNAHGQLGINDTTERQFPTFSNSDVAQVYLTPSSNNLREWSRLVIRKTDGTFWGVGHNGQYQLGLGNNSDQVSWQQLTWILPNPKSVWNLGNEFGCMVVQQNNGTITVTGFNDTGCLGIGSNTTPTAPTTASLWQGGDSTMVIQSVHLGGPLNNTNGRANNQNMFMLLDNGTTSRIVGSGTNGFGVFGRGDILDSNVPVEPIGLTGRVAKLTTGGPYAATVYALMTNGDLWGWGYNVNGQVADGNASVIGVKSPFKMATNITGMFGELNGWNWQGYLTPSPLFLSTAGEYFCCGYGANGQMGSGFQSTTNAGLVKVRLPPNTAIKFIAATGNDEGISRIVVTTDNKLLVWGYNGTGLIEPGQTGSDYTVPTQFIPSLLRK